MTSTNAVSIRGSHYLKEHGLTSLAKLARLYRLSDRDAEVLASRIPATRRHGGAGMYTDADAFHREYQRQQKDQHMAPKIENVPQPTSITERTVINGVVVYASHQLPCGIGITEMEVTPEIARRWLENNTRNRRVIRTNVDRLAKEIKNHWRTTHQGIAFDRSGTLLDGQHRLMAVVEADTSVRVLVYTNVPEETAVNIDTGKVRSLIDAINIAHRWGWTNAHGAVASAMMAKGAYTVQPRSDAFQFCERHREAIEFAVAQPLVPGANRAAVRAVIARAYYTMQQDALARFAEIISVGSVVNPRPGDASVLKWRGTLTGPEYRGVSGSKVGVTVYRKTSRALRAYRDGEDLGIIYEDPDVESSFPLPDEE